MKIISKFTDYYDYLVSYYGFDETRVYDRRNQPKTVLVELPNKSNGRFLLSICDTYLPIIKKDGVFIYDYRKLSKSSYYDSNFLFRYEGRRSSENILN